MASWTDNVEQLTRYNPHISTNPADVMVSTGMYLQQQYQEGLDTVNAHVSSLNNLEFAKKGAKDHVDAQMGNLRNGLSRSLAGDLSNQSLVSQIKGAVSTIANDPIVETNLIATANAKAQFEAMKSARKEGKSNIANEWDFQSKYSSWLNDGKLDTDFSERFTPYTDYMKDFLTKYKEIHPSSSLTQDQIRIKDGTGEIEVLNEKEKEGVSASTINNLWASVKNNPDVQNQLSIDGKFKYRGINSPEQLINITRDNYNRAIFNIDEQIKGIQEEGLIDKTLSASDINNKIIALQEYKKQAEQDYKNVADLIANNSLDEVKAKLHDRDVTNSLISTYSWSKEQSKIVNSPVFEAHMKQADYELKQSKQAWEVAKDSRDYALELQKLEIERQKATKGKTTGSGESGADLQTGILPIEQAAGEKSSQSFYDNVKSLEGTLDQGIQELVYNVFNVPGTIAKNPVKLVTEGGTTSYKLNVDPNDPTAYKSVKEANEALSEAYQKTRAAAMTGKNPSAAKDFANLVDPVARKLENARYTAKQIEEPFKNTMEELKKSLGVQDFNKKFKLRLVSTGDKLDSVSVNDLVNYSVYLNSDDANVKNAAMSDLKKSLGADKADALRQFGVYKSGDYDKANKILEAVKKNKGLLETFQKREAAFKNAQSAFNPLENTIITNNAQGKEEWRQRFLKTADRFNLNNNVKDFTQYLNDDGSKSVGDKLSANIYSWQFDKSTGKYYLNVTRGSNDKQSLEVDRQAIVDMGFKVDDPFWDKFGSDLSQTKNKTTDVQKAGAAKAYLLQNADANRKYTVTYHLKGVGGDKYRFFVYAYDKNGNQVVPGVEVPNDIDQENVMNIINTGIPDKDIEALIKK